MRLSPMMNRFRTNKYFKSILEFNVFLTTLGALIADVLSPVAPISLWVGLFLLGLLAVSPVFKSIGWFDEKLSALLGEYWSGPTRCVLFIACLTMLLTFSVSTQQAENGGYMASRSETISSIQEQLGIIVKQSAQIEENTRKTAANTERISVQMEGLKREVSIDPRKEIANLGLSWTHQDFASALMSGDLQVIELFLSGGMKPTAMRKGASVVLYGMQPSLNNNPVDVLILLQKYGFDLDTHLIDSRILTNLNRNLPPYYESEDMPEGYSAFYKRFNGPLLMWVTILATYRGASEDEIELIKYLVSEGVEKQTTISYLNFSESWLEGTRPYKEIRPLLE